MRHVEFHSVPNREPRSVDRDRFVPSKQMLADVDLGADRGQDVGQGRDVDRDQDVGRDQGEDRGRDVGQGRGRDQDRRGLEPTIRRRSYLKKPSQLDLETFPADKIRRLPERFLERKLRPFPSNSEPQGLKVFS